MKQMLFTSLLKNYFHGEKKVKKNRFYAHGKHIDRLNTGISRIQKRPSLKQGARWWVKNRRMVLFIYTVSLNNQFRHTE